MFDLSNGGTEGPDLYYSILTIVLYWMELGRNESNKHRSVCLLFFLPIIDARIRRIRGITLSTIFSLAFLIQQRVIYLQYDPHRGHIDSHLALCAGTCTVTKEHYDPHKVAFLLKWSYDRLIYISIPFKIPVIFTYFDASVNVDSSNP